MTRLYFLLSAVFLSTVSLGSPIAQFSSSPSSSLDDFISFFPQDLPPLNLNQGIYTDALESHDMAFQDFAVPDQQIRPSLVFDMALAPNSQGEKIDDETAHYRSFNCHQKYSVCCQGRDLSVNSQHEPCSKKSGNINAGYEEVSSPKDMRYGQYCYRPFYTTACDDSLWGNTKGMTCFTDCQIPVVKPQGQDTTQELKDSVREGLFRDDSLRDFHF